MDKRTWVSVLTAFGGGLLFAGVSVIASVWPERVKAHPYTAVSLGVVGLVLLLATLLGLAFSRLQEAEPVVSELPSQSSSSPSVTNYAPNGIAGNNLLNPQVHNYAQSKAAVIKSVSVRPLLPATRSEDAREFRRQVLSQGHAQFNPGLVVSLRLQEAIDNPTFKVTCSDRFTVVDLQFCQPGQSMGYGVQCIPQDDECSVVIRSQRSLLATPDMHIDLVIRSVSAEPVTLVGDVEGYAL